MSEGHHEEDNLLLSSSTDNVVSVEDGKNQDACGCRIPTPTPTKAQQQERSTGRGRKHCGFLFVVFLLVLWMICSDRMGYAWFNHLFADSKMGTKEMKNNTTMDPSPRNTTGMNNKTNMDLSPRNTTGMNTTTSATIDSFPTKSMYSVARTDRSGAAIVDMIRAAAYAKSQNFVYMGACYYSLKKQHRRRMGTRYTLIKKTGLHKVLGGTELVRCPPEGKMTFYRGRNLPVQVLGRDSYKDPKYMTPEFIEYLHLQTREFYNQNKKDKPIIAVHVRRGDVGPCSVTRYLPNSYYHSVIQQYALDQGIGTEVHVYSEKQSFEPWTEFCSALNSSLSLASCTLHLDSDLTAAWGGLMIADLLIMSRSTFSYVPALLNPNTVVYPGLRDPMPTWVIASMTNETVHQMQELQARAGCPGTNFHRRLKQPVLNHLLGDIVSWFSFQPVKNVAHHYTH